MTELLATKSNRGDMYLSIARMHLEKHEWGLARKAIETALDKGQLTDEREARRLRLEIYARLGRKVS